MNNRKHFLAALDFFSLFIYGLIIAVVGPILDILQQSFQVNAATVGLLFTGLSIGFIISVFSGILLIRKYSMPRIHRYGQIGMLLGLIGVSISPNFGLTVGFFVLMGIGGGLIQISVNGNIPDLYPDHKGAALNILHLFFGLGAFVGPFFAANYFAWHGEWRGIFGIVAFLALIQNFLLFLAYGRLSHYQRQKKHDMQQNIASHPQFRKVLSYGYIYLLIIAVVLYVGVEMGLTAWIVLYLQEGANMGKTNASAFLSYFWLAITIGRLIVAYINRKISSDIVLIVLIMMGGSSLYLFMVMKNPAILIIFILTMGLGFSAIFPSLMHLGAEVFPRHIPAMSNLLLIALGLGLLIFPWLVGMIKEYFSLQGGMYFMLGSFLLLLLLSLIIMIRYRHYHKKGSVL